MEKSLKQLKCIERISRQTRHYRTHLNQVCNDNLHTQLSLLDDQCERNIARRTSSQQIEEERKKLLRLTIEQITKEQEPSLLTDETQIISKNNENSSSSFIVLPSRKTPCNLFSHNCQFYPCQPVYQYTSFMTKDHDRTLQKRSLSVENSTNNSNVSSVHDSFKQNRRQLPPLTRNQYYELHRHMSIQRKKVELDKQNLLLRERVTDRKTFGYIKTQQRQLSQAIKHHLQISAKFCE
ncbi:unnamed protein product [Adineta steineri]|uniref:Uncharacterized protein n=2 Tax=Adineta steineri TaxID=433720 RepID=A0A813N8M8_9BILA|nr:unnamed protein product [Adineta steineri]CAF3798122.1 unnamed protein product [Adineta steineri]